MPPQSLPTPPESIEMGLKPPAMHDDTFATQQQRDTAFSQQLEPNIHSPQLSPCASTGTTEFFMPKNELPRYSGAWKPTLCDCFRWQASNLTSLRTFSTFDESLQCITATLAACQRTVGCQTCEKDSSMVLILIASLQMVLDRLDALLSHELRTSPSFPPMLDSVIPQYPQPEQQSAICLLQLRHMLFKTQNTLKDIRDIIPTPKRSSSIDSAIFSYMGTAPGSSPDGPDCLHQVLDKLQAGIDALLGTIGSYRT